MKLTILGSGTCVSGMSDEPNRFPPAFLVEWEKEKMLFDCSEGVRFRLEQAGHEYTDIHHVAISHAHPDHNAFIHFYQAVYVKGLRDPNAKNEQMDLYCPDHIANTFVETFAAYEAKPKGELFDFPKLNFHPMSKRGSQTASVGGATLRAANVHHGFGRTDALAYRLETPEGVFVYSGDTGDCEGIRSICKEADLFVCEASTPIGGDGKDYGHLNPYETGVIAKEGKVKHLILFHYYTKPEEEAAMLEDVRRSGYEGKVIIGKDFQTIEL